MTARPPQSTFRGNIVHALKMVFAAKSAWAFVAVWFASVIVLVRGGHHVPVAGILVGVVLLLLSLALRGVTESAPATIVAKPERWRVSVQLGLVSVFIVLTGWNNLAFHNVTEAQTGRP